MAGDTDSLLALSAVEQRRLIGRRALSPVDLLPVSYTHLTLPTSDLV